MLFFLKSRTRQQQQWTKMSTPPVDLSRCYPISSMLPPQNDQAKKTTKEALLATASELMQECCKKSSRKGSLYCGGLGPHVYLRYQMSKMVSDPKRKTKLLHDAKTAAEYALSSARQQSSSIRVSLLEGKQVGALCLLVAIDHRLGMSDSDTNKVTTSHILSLLDDATSRLPPGECEVLYGRAGAIQAILWLRQELQDTTLGQDLVARLANTILYQGQGGEADALLLSWEWHGKCYLGAAHGIVGILQTLLSLEQADWDIILRGMPKALLRIQETMQVLANPTFCHSSGNLKSSYSKKSMCTDRLVHWCHGAPGQVLLLVKAAEVFPKNRDLYLQQARKVAEDVLWPRGLLHNGVGLCHGISGNGMVLMRLAMVEKQAEERTKWRDRAFQYMHFANEHLHELRLVPDRPYSLFEGMGGLVCFLLQCVAVVDADVSDEQKDLLRFPLYEFV